MNRLFQYIGEHLVIGPERRGELLATVLILLVIGMVRWLVLRIAFRRIDDVRVRYHWRKTSLYTAVGVGLVVVCWIWFERLHTLSTFLGLVGAGVVIVLQKPIVNLAGWAFILSRRPFQVGDRIEIGGVGGDVIDLRIFQFTLMEIGNWVEADQSTGRIVHIPNGKVFEEHLANYGRGFQYIWNEIAVQITFESDWRKAKKLLQGIVEQHAGWFAEEAERSVRQASQTYMIFYSKLTPTVYTSVRDNGVRLTIRYVCPPRRRRGVEQSIWEDVLAVFGPHADIEFAYPTQRFYQRPIEGKRKGETI